MRRELPARLSLVPPSSEKPQLSPPNTKSGRPQSETATYCTRSAKRSPSADILHCICKPWQRKTQDGTSFRERTCPPKACAGGDRLVAPGEAWRAWGPMQHKTRACVACDRGKTDVIYKPSLPHRICNERARSPNDP